RVRRRERRHHLAHDRQRLFGLHATGAAQTAHQGLAREQLHGQKRDAGALGFVKADVEDAAHVGMGHLAGQQDLALEPFDRAIVIGNFGAYGLERHVLAQLLVERLVDLAHAAVRDEAHDPIAARDQVPGLEAGLEAGAAVGCARLPAQGRYTARRRVVSRDRVMRRDAVLLRRGVASVAASWSHVARWRRRRAPVAIMTSGPAERYAAATRVRCTETILEIPGSSMVTPYR